MEQRLILTRLVNHLFRRFILGLILFSLLALYANENWMKKRFKIDYQTNANVSATDDRSEGGKSLASLRKSPQGLELSCNIVPGYQWPFCELIIELGKGSKGVNLNQYDSVKLQLHSAGPESDQSVRVFLRNYHPAYSKSSTTSTLKPHEVVFDPNQHGNTVELKMNQFMVASWWTQSHPTSLEFFGPQLDNVVAISFTTAGNVIPGQHKITVESIEFVGQWISTENFRLIIIFVLLSAIFLYLVWEWRLSKQALNESEQLKAALERSNQVLESRVDERTRALAASNSRLIETLQNLEGTRHELVQNEKNAALGALVSGVAHELNTPIGNALLVCSTLADKIKELEIISETKFTRKALKDFFTESTHGTAIMQQNLERAADLISSFKQLSADQHSEQRRQFRLIDVVHETQLAMLPSIRQTPHELNIDIDPNIEMDTYPGPLSQIFINFINNALLHAFDNIPHGHMLLTARKLEKDSVEIIFSDDGNGIPATILRRVFEPFFTTKLGKGGSGLGMHLAHTVITQIFGGKIEIHSLPGEGTSIQIVVPLVAPEVNKRILKIGVPKDVLEDYLNFAGDRDILEIQDFSGEYSRRDVVELAFFIRALKSVWSEIKYDLCPVDSYANGIEQLRASLIEALATSCWESDLLAYAEEICMSEAMIADGRSIVGIYSSPHNQLAHQSKSLEDFQQLRVVSNRDWSADWNTLEQLGVEHCLDVKTWRQMVYMVSSGEVDALLAPFSKHLNMKIELDDCQLLPVTGLKIALTGSRHFASSKSVQGFAIAETVFPELKRYLDDGSFDLALRQCGFYNNLAETWQLLHPR